MGVILTSYFKVKGFKIPRVLLGTSPFIGAGQFGERAYLYQLMFYNKPEKIRDLMVSVFEMRVRGVQLLPYHWVVSGLELALKSYDDIVIVGSILPGEVNESLERLKDLNAIAVLLHGAISDTLNESIIKYLLTKLKILFPLTGIVTHTPGRTIPWFIEKNFEFDLILAPLNMAGIFMDIPPEKAIDLYKNVGKPIIGKKILAGGRLNPKEALTFASQSKCLDGVALGVASFEEAEETFKIALKLFNF